MGPLWQNDGDDRSALFLSAASGDKDTFEVVMRAMTEAVKIAKPDFEVRHYLQ